MIKNINIRFNLDKEEHRKAWNYMQTMDKSVEKTYSKVIIKSLIRYFENADAENRAEISENYWERFRSEIGNLLRGQTALPTIEMEKLAEKEDNHLPKISEDVLDALEDLFWGKNSRNKSSFSRQGNKLGKWLILGTVQRNREICF